MPQTVMKVTSRSVAARHAEVAMFPYKGRWLRGLPHFVRLYLLRTTD